MSQTIEEHARRRRVAGQKLTGNRRHFGDPDFVHSIGVMGEKLVCEKLGLPFDLRDRPSGDKGHDIKVGGITVDVKTDSYEGENLEMKVERGKVRSDAYILVHYDIKTAKLRIVGWEYGICIKRRPTKSYGYVTMNHFIPAQELRPWIELECRIKKVVRKLEAGD